MRGTLISQSVQVVLKAGWGGILMGHQCVRNYIVNDSHGKEVDPMSHLSYCEIANRD